mgnify:FL=1
MSNLNNVFNQVKVSKNVDVNDFMCNFLYHNEDFFKRCLKLGITKFDSSSSDLGQEGVDIYYEKGTWKWGSQGMENQMVKRGHIKVLRSDSNTSCLQATNKLINRILNNIYRTIENLKCVREKRYDDRKLNPCR